MPYFILCLMFIVLTACNESKASMEADDNEVLVLTEKMIKTTQTAAAVYEPLRNEMALYGKITAYKNKKIEVFPIADAKDAESDIHKVKVGMEAELRTSKYPDKVFEGRVVNLIEPETEAMKLCIKLDNTDYLLKPDIHANIKLSYTESDHKMIAIPVQALISDKSKHYVMVFNSRDDIESRQIEVFRQVEDKVYVSKGLEEGEKVMTTNQLLVYDALND